MLPRHLSSTLFPYTTLFRSSYVQVTRSDKSSSGILFGGDLGRYARPILPDPTPGVDCDVLLVESTYGDRVHPNEDDGAVRSEEHTSELQSPCNLVCRLLLEK